MNTNHKVGDIVVIINRKGYFLNNGSGTNVASVSGRIMAIEPVMANVTRPNWILVKDEATGWKFAAASTNVWRTE